MERNNTFMNKKGKTKQRLVINKDRQLLNKLARDATTYNKQKKTEKLKGTNYFKKLKTAFANKDKNSHAVGETPYLQSLLHPELAKNSKIPGTATASVGIHRKQIFRQAVNALGNFHLVFQPENALVDNNNLNTACYYSNDAVYNAASALSPSQYIQLQVANPYNLPPNTARTYRCVSASVTVRSLAPALTRSGDIHVGFVQGITQSVFSVGPSQDECGYGVLSAINNMVGGKYALCHVEKGMCGRGIWIPQDITCLDFKLVNSASTGYDNFISIIGIGLAPSSNVEIEANYNYEVTPGIGSVLYGMESICKHNQEPGKVWRQAYDAGKVATAVYDTSCSLPTSITNPVQPINEIDRLANMYLNGRPGGFIA